MGSTKECNMCHKILDINEFPEKSGKCKPCRNEHDRKKRKEKRKELLGTKICFTCHVRKNDTDFKTKRICIECFNIGKSDIERKCIGCKIIKPASKFYKSGRYHLYQKKCKECDSKSKSRSNCRKYTINEKYFEKVDTPEKAYILGLLYADGYNSEKTGRINLH